MEAACKEDMVAAASVTAVADVAVAAVAVAGVAVAGAAVAGVAVAGVAVAGVARSPGCPGFDGPSAGAMGPIGGFWPDGAPTGLTCRHLVSGSTPAVDWAGRRAETSVATRGEALDSLAAIAAIAAAAAEAEAADPVVADPAAVAVRSTLVPEAPTKMEA